MANKNVSKIEKLKKQREVINNRIQKMEAMEKNRERKRDTRKKILIGSYHLDQAKKSDTMDALNKIMDKFLKRNSDRELFDLEPLNE